MDSQPTNHVVKWHKRLIPGTDRDTPSTTASPFFLVAAPESQALFGVSVPFSETGVIVYAWRQIRGRTGRNGISRAVGSTVFTGHAKLVDTEGDWLVHL